MDEPLLIVGLGASAGGIKAIRQFFERVPADSGIAYVVILHLSPDHDSHLAEVLQVSAAIPVTQVSERVKAQANNVYVIAPNQSLSIHDGYLQLAPITSFEERRAPVDMFFRTLAEAHRSRSVAVILSGTGANGSMGLKRIKEHGGICLAQRPEDAEFTDMPLNAIATGMVDEVLPAAEMPAKIIGYGNTLRALRLPEETIDPPPTDEQALRDIFSLLRSGTGHDFSNYKRATMLRRFARRMGMHTIDNLPGYAAYLREHGEETRSLLRDLLIGVTNFFRDKPAFDALESKVIPALFARKTEGNQVRVWVAGCATGEEAYSVAMLLAEHAGNLPGTPGLQVFATDIDEAALAAARDGVYTLNDAADVSPERLRRFFTKEGELYRVRRELREVVLFAHHNLIKDPPFSHLDLACCRNLLIYLNRTAQQRVMDLMQFALNPEGFLFLGSSESADGATDLFSSFDKDARIFRSRAVTPRFGLSAAELAASPRALLRPVALPAVEQDTRDRLSLLDVHRRLLEQYAPPSVVVNEEYDIVHLTERAGQYLQYGGGEPSHNLLKAVRPELRIELRTALYQALQQQTTVEARDLAVNLGDRTVRVHLRVRPVLRDDDAARGFFLVIFEEAEAGSEPMEPAAAVRPGDAARQLEDELMRVRTQLRSTVERHETQAEELKASNEELHAMNEELRSSAEELETSKEELQSLNEELRTVNQELKTKVDEQIQANDDIQNLINAAEIGTIFVDRTLRIKLFTPKAREIFNLIAADRGRPLSDINTMLLGTNLPSDLGRVLEHLERIEREVRTRNGRWY